MIHWISSNVFLAVLFGPYSCVLRNFSNNLDVFFYIVICYLISEIPDIKPGDFKFRLKFKQMSFFFAIFVLYEFPVDYFVAFQVFLI